MKATAIKRQAIEDRGKPKGLEPWRSNVGQSLQDYGRERQPFLKGGRHDGERAPRTYAYVYAQRRVIDR